MLTFSKPLADSASQAEQKMSAAEILTRTCLIRTCRFVEGSRTVVLFMPNFYPIRVCSVKTKRRESPDRNAEMLKN